MLWPQSSDLSIQSIWWINSVVVDNLIQICRRLIKSISRPITNSYHPIACLRVRRFNPCRKVPQSRNHAYSAMSCSVRKRSVINAVVHVKQNGARQTHINPVRCWWLTAVLTRQPTKFAETTEKTNQDVRRNIFSTCTFFIFLILLYLLQPWLRKKLRYTSPLSGHLTSITYSFSLTCLDWVVITDQLREIMVWSWMYVRC